MGKQRKQSHSFIERRMIRKVSRKGRYKKDIQFSLIFNISPSFRRIFYWLGTTNLEMFHTRNQPTGRNATKSFIR